jgi:hypothetical protein
MAKTQILKAYDVLTYLKNNELIPLSFFYCINIWEDSIILQGNYNPQVIIALNNLFKCTTWKKKEINLGIQHTCIKKFKNITIDIALIETH